MTLGKLSKFFGPQYAHFQNKGVAGKPTISPFSKICSYINRWAPIWQENIRKWNRVLCSVVSNFAAPWTVACPAPLSWEFSRQEYWSRLPFPTPGDLSIPGIEPASPTAPVLADGCFTTVPHGKPNFNIAMATHSSALAWRIPGTEEPSGLPSVGSHRVGHDWSDLAAAAAVKLYNMVFILHVMQIHHTIWIIWHYFFQNCDCNIHT